MKSRPAILSQSRLRDFAKAYIDHTAFGLFPAEPLSWHSFRKSAIITLILLGLLSALYYSINDTDESWLSLSVTPVIAILIFGAIIVDYLSIVRTLYVMRYAKTAAHFLELVFLFFADLILTANLFSFVVAGFLALAAVSSFYIHGAATEIYISTMASPSYKDLDNCGMSKWELHVFDIEAVAKKLGLVPGCATVFVGLGGRGKESNVFMSHHVPFLSNDISTEHVTSALFGECVQLEKRPIIFSQEKDEFEEEKESNMWRLRDRGKDEDGTDKVKEPTGYKCRVAPIRDMAPLNLSPLSIYVVAYDLATMGQRYFLVLMGLYKLEIDIEKVSREVSFQLIQQQDSDFGFLYDHGKTRNMKHIGSINALCADCFVTPFVDEYFASIPLPRATVVIPVPVFFLSSFFMTFFFYLLMFVFIFCSMLLGQVPLAITLMERFTKLADYPFTVVFAFSGILLGAVAGALIAAGVL